MGLNLTTFEGAMKEHYTSDYVENLTYMKNPFYALLPKMENFGGSDLPIVQIFGNPQGRSADFKRARARGAVTSSAVDRFVLTRAHDYSVATLDNETILASKGDENAFLEAMTTEVDGAINALTLSIVIALYGTGWGDIGQIAVGSSVTGLTLQLARISDASNFERQQELIVCAAVSTGNPRALGSNGNGLIITGIDRTKGILTFGFNVNDAADGIPTIAAGDYLFVRGDRVAAAAGPQKLSGLEAWNPVSVTNTPFFGVDRTQDVTRLAGISIDATNVPIEEALIEGANQVGNEGGTIDHYFMNYRTFSALVKSLGSKVQYIDLKATAAISFRGVQVMGEDGPINVVPDRSCPSNRIRGVHLSMFKLYSLGKAVRVIEEDGLSSLRQTDDDGVELRWGFYGNLGCRDTRSQVNIQI